MDSIIDFFLSQPKRMTSLGRVLIMLAAIVISLGLIGRIAISIPSALSLLQKASAPPTARTLAEIYPDFWTWWIPETFVGCLPAIIIAAMGIWLWSYGRKIIRVYH